MQQGELTYTTMETRATCNPLSCTPAHTHTRRSGWWAAHDADCAARSDSGNAKGKLHTFEACINILQFFPARAYSASKQRGAERVSARE